MRVGIIVRCEDRGLGNLTRELVAHLEPERVLVVLPSARIGMGRPSAHLGWYPDATTIHWDGHKLDERPVRRFLAGLDVVYSAETWYDARLPRWARDEGVRTVLHVMPEYMNRDRTADVIWNPTTWRMRYLPPGTRHVPIPVTRNPHGATSPSTGPPRWLHVAGVQAAGDRNGTRIVAAAVQYLQYGHDVKVRTQEPVEWWRPPAANVRLDVKVGNVEDRWELYRDADALLMPRRYGGLSLPVLEALGSGIPILMTDCPPQDTEWPVIPIGVEDVRYIRTKPAPITLHNADPRALGRMMDEYAARPGMLDHPRRAVKAYVDAYDWTAMLPRYGQELERACG